MEVRSAITSKRSLRRSRDIHPRDFFVQFTAERRTSENGRFCFIPQALPERAAGHPCARAVGQDRLQDWLANRIKAKKAIIQHDTCESGALD